MLKQGYVSSPRHSPSKHWSARQLSHPKGRVNSVSNGTEDGTTQECSETGASMVSLSATIGVVGGAEPDSIGW